MRGNILGASRDRDDGFIQNTRLLTATLGGKTSGPSMTMFVFLSGPAWAGLVTANLGDGSNVGFHLTSLCRGSGENILPYCDLRLPLSWHLPDLIMYQFDLLITSGTTLAFEFRHLGLSLNFNLG
jgi:hypothetical protein